MVNLCLPLIIEKTQLTMTAQPQSAKYCYVETSNLDGYYSLSLSRTHLAHRHMLALFLVCISLTQTIRQNCGHTCKLRGKPTVRSWVKGEYRNQVPKSSTRFGTRFLILVLDFGTRFLVPDLVPDLVLDFGTWFWYLILVPDSGTWFWYQILVPDSGTWFWYLILVLDSGTRFWYQILVLDFGTWFWYLILVLDFGTWFWYLILVPDSGTWFWYQILVLDFGTGNCDRFFHNYFFSDPFYICRKSLHP